MKLSVPTALTEPGLLVEVPGGAIVRPADGEEHVHGRWLVIEDRMERTAAPGRLPSCEEGAGPFRGESRGDRHRLERPA